MSSLEWNIPC